MIEANTILVYECFYCYANTSKEQASENYKIHIANKNAENITGK